jgi:Copper type II ascorbate-dependent monooxygenase, C-terminal domain
MKDRVAHALARSLAGLSTLLVACSEKIGDGSTSCAATEELTNGKCVDPLRRYEPAERVDVDNVVVYGDMPSALELPDPPKSGFRLVVPPRTFAPGDELEGCQAWAYPNIKNKNIYAARIYTTGALHHSNLYGVPFSSTAGPSPYPACAPGQSDLSAQVPNWLAGDITDVLFANSTQIDGGEQIVFHPGMAFKITTENREVATTIHWLNVTGHEITSETVYDFFTMPDDQVTQPIVPFVFENEGFQIAPHSVGDITTTCDLVEHGNIVSIMPHTHKRATAFTVDLIASDGSTTQIFEAGAFDTASDIKVLDEPISLEGFAQIRHQCTVNNDLADTIVWGIGNNEMCTFFGYLYPPSAQLLGFVAKSSDSCAVLDLGKSRK